MIGWIGECWQTLLETEVWTATWGWVLANSAIHPAIDKVKGELSEVVEIQRGSNQPEMTPFICTIS